MNSTMSNHPKPDADRHKGAFEPEDRRERGNTSLHGQLPHRGEDVLIKSADTDFPEPGENPEHSGEPEAQSTLDRDEEICSHARKGKTTQARRAETRKS
jgi:hypothetical protein